MMAPAVGERTDLRSLKLKLFDAMAEGADRSGGPPVCKLWALYRKALRLFLLSELAQPELEAIVLYTLGPENGEFEVIGPISTHIMCQTDGS
jgi:hypothetical protein